MADNAIILTLIARIPAAGIADFRAYEDQVLPLLAAHNGVLQRRLRGADGGVEGHIVRFSSAVAFDGFPADPRRAHHAHLLERSGAAMESLVMEDVASCALA